MRVDLKKLVGVLVLLCLGFILGRLTILADVNAASTMSEVGRYELVCASNVAMFRINTATGDVEMFKPLKSEDGTMIGVWKSITE